MEVFFVVAVLVGALMFAEWLAGPTPPAPDADGASEHAAHLARLQRAHADPHELTLSEIEYWAARFEARRVRYWAQLSFDAYLTDPAFAETVARRRQIEEAVRRADLCAAMGPLPVAGIRPGSFPVTGIVPN